MTTEPVTLEALLATRATLRIELPRRLTSRQRAFLVGLAYGQPDWALLQCAHAADLPALRWKLANLEAFRKKRPADFEAQAEELDKRLEFILSGLKPRLYRADAVGCNVQAYCSASPTSRFSVAETAIWRLAILTVDFFSTCARRPQTSFCHPKTEAVALHCGSHEVRKMPTPARHARQQKIAGPA